MAHARPGSRFVAVAALVSAFLAVSLNTWIRPPAFAPMRAAAAAGIVLAASPSTAAIAAVADSPSLFDFGSSMPIAEKQIALGGLAKGGGLEGTFEMKGKASKKDFIDDEKVLAKEEKLENEFDKYVGTFGILFVGAFIAPMVTYFWYVRDSDPWEN
eukprot:CAMPEP_0172669848 /NCGR_PEP_ID=MMETSP1074-20121228/9933_1 /TAXON_ID=2916 /ORGANISM="Ceratium fusus, Strain PA161109" /LENGTH=156 /DNA_ID=CAMNT_0013486679 /DNA_START=46 /DNA_END=516 /DNA_ORIENTATION=+